MSFRPGKWEHNKKEIQIPAAVGKTHAPNYALCTGFISLFSYGFKWPRDGIHFTVLDIIRAYQLVLIHYAAICKGYYHLWVNIT